MKTLEERLAQTYCWRCGFAEHTTVERKKERIKGHFVGHRYQVECRCGAHTSWYGNATTAVGTWERRCRYMRGKRKA